MTICLFTRWIACIFVSVAVVGHAQQPQIGNRASADPRAGAAIVSLS